VRLEGKVALISGTARGMGRAAALRFAREGANLAIDGGWSSVLPGQTTQVAQ
jgi:NAD(P)-dependent dehydrogenase (short-subunit alcohol dehydrogenase family)